METLPLKRGIIKNIDFLVSHGESDIRRDALDIVEAGILGADPAGDFGKDLAGRRTTLRRRQDL